MNDAECGKPDNLKHVAREVSARIQELEKRLHQVSSHLVADSSPIVMAASAGSYVTTANSATIFTANIGPVDADDLATPLRDAGKALREVEQLILRIEQKLGL